MVREFSAYESRSKCSALSICCVTRLQIVVKSDGGFVCQE
jgi:hypothetical protein